MRRKAGARAASASHPLRAARGVTGLFAGALIWAAAGPALAGTSLPALFDVTGVASSDGLNMRERPDVAAPVVGQLAPDAEDVEVSALSRDGSWGQVNHSDRAAWVAMRFLSRQEGPDWWDPETPLSCYGTEPFWGLRIEAGEARFDSPEGPDAPVAVEARAVLPGGDAAGMSALLGLRFGGSFAVVRTAACSDGMSDRANGLGIELFRAGPDGLGALTGCCSLLR